MKLFSFLRRRRKTTISRLHWRTAQRIYVVIQAFLRTQDERDTFTLAEIAEMTGQSSGCMSDVLAHMERLELVGSYFDEPALPGVARQRLYFLQARAYAWAHDAMLLGTSPSDPAPQ